MVSILLTSFALIPNVHGGSNISFIQATAVAVQTGGTTISTGSFVDLAGDTIIIAVWGTGAFNGFAYSDTQSNIYTQKIASVTGLSGGASTYFATASVGVGGSNVVTVSTGGASRTYAIAALEYRNVLGFGVTTTSQNDGIAGGSTSDTSSVTFVNTAGNGGAALEIGLIGGIPSTTPSITYNNGQTQRILSKPNGGGALQGLEVDDYPIPATSFTISSTWSWSPGCGVSTCSDSRSALELLGSPTQTITTISQCYGNCGNPAITLLNTVSTHTINWNTSITLFYEFQPTINAFVNNITTNLATTYPSQQFAPIFALYHASCNIGTTPFTPACQGTVTGLAGTGNSFSKGRSSINGGTQFLLVSSATDWYAISITFTIGPVDLNDTNTGVAIFQASGNNPSPLTGVQFNGASKIGLWTWITGNVLGSAPPPAPAPVCLNNFAQVDCFLPALVNMFCSQITAACQTTSALLWVPILAIIFLVITFGIFLSMFPKVSVSFSEGMGILTIFMLIVVFMMTSAGLLPLWVDIIIFMIVAIEFGDKVKGRLS